MIYYISIVLYSVILNKVLVKKSDIERDIYVEGNNIIRGEVLAVGAGTKDEPMHIVEGNLVLFDKNSAIELPFENDLYVIEQQAIIAIEKGDESKK